MHFQIAPALFLRWNPLQNFAELIKDLSGSIGISAEEQYMTVCQFIDSDVYTFLCHHDIDTIDHLISCSVANLTPLESQHHTLETLNSQFGQQVAKPPSTKHGKKRNGRGGRYHRN